MIFPERDIIQEGRKWAKGPEFSLRSGQDPYGPRSGNRDALDGTNVGLPSYGDRAVLDQSVGAEQGQASNLGLTILDLCIGLDIRPQITDQRQAQNRSAFRIEGDPP